ncbi:MAG: phosphotransferase [Actinomycetota bacterium]|nr:phosphotransferase [Actinomycetota bacterium]
MTDRQNRESNGAQGAVLSVVGPDGVGKSTLIDSVVADALKDRRTMRIRNVGLLPRRTVPQVPVTEPHKDPPYPLLVSLAKVAYVYTDYVLGWFLRVRPFVRSGGWVILERGWWDMAVDPTRYRMRLPSWLMWYLGRALPRPDLLLVLEAPAEVVFERKRELPIEELRRQQETWRERLPASQPHAFLDASLSAREVLARAENEVNRLSMASGGTRSGTAVNLPRTGDPRWVLPRGSAPVAAAGLRVYHPVTLKGILGWQLGRGLARLGVFKLLPAGQSPPDAVNEAVEKWVPSGGSVAVARANHPGRYVALVLAGDGSAVAAAKIASDGKGVAALEREAVNLRELGAHLRPPLVAPRLIEASNGLLVLEAVSWSPRPRPWHLPEDVAAALGAFFINGRDSSQSGGASHGDFAPWNLLRSDGKWVVLDWESAGSQGAPWQDLWHYVVQGHALLKRPTTRAIRRGLDGEGWVGAAMRAYASAAGLPLSGASEALMSYLRISMAELDPATSDGRMGIEARRALLLRMSR